MHPLYLDIKNEIRWQFHAFALFDNGRELALFLVFYIVEACDEVIVDLLAQRAQLVEVS